METTFFIVEYSGDQTEKLKQSGTLAPFRLLPNGNTEQSIEVIKGGNPITKEMSFEGLVGMMEPFIMKDCGKNGIVVAKKWVQKSSK